MRFCYSKIQKLKNAVEIPSHIGTVEVWDIS